MKDCTTEILEDGRCSSATWPVTGQEQAWVISEIFEASSWGISKRDRIKSEGIRRQMYII
jgi:hypothetical protein